MSAASQAPQPPDPAAVAPSTPHIETPKYSPTKPIMGGILKTSEETPWTGGVPKPDWSGLAAIPIGPKTACQLRPESGKSAMYSYTERIKGLKEPLNDIMGIDGFKRAVSQHLVRYGLDTIAYLPDPHDPTKSVHIIDGSTRFTISSCQAAATAQAKNYDRYDRENDASAVEFLLASLSKERSASVLHRCSKLNDSPYGDVTDTFPVVWLHLMQDIAPTSFETFQQLAKRLEGLRPTQYPGEDIGAMVRDFYSIAEPLDLAGHYLPSYTSYLVTAALSAGGTTSDQDILFFRQEVNMIRKRLNELLTILPSLDKANQQQQLVSNKCTFKHIGTELTNLYTLALTRGQWPPAHQTRDRKAPTAYALKPSNMNRPPINMAEVTCYHCGEKGHFKRDCPKLKDGGSAPSKAPENRNSNRGTRGGRGGRGGRGMSRSRVTSPNQTPWRGIPPKPGEPETLDKNGKRYYWCAHCERWTGTHGTTGHMNNKTRKNLPPQGNVCTPCTLSPSHDSWGIAQPLPPLEVAPSAWKARIIHSDQVSWWDSWGKSLLPLLLGLFFRPSDLCSTLGVWFSNLAVATLNLLFKGMSSCVASTFSFLSTSLIPTNALYVGIATINLCVLWCLLGPLLSSADPFPRKAPRWRARGRLYAPQRRLSQRTTWRCRSPARSGTISEPHWIRWVRRDIARLGIFIAVYRLMRHWSRRLHKAIYGPHRPKPFKSTKDSLDRRDEHRKYLERKRLRYLRQRMRKFTKS